MGSLKENTIKTYFYLKMNTFITLANLLIRILVNKQVYCNFYSLIVYFIIILPNKAVLK